MAYVTIEFGGQRVVIPHMGLDREELEDMAREDPNGSREGDWILLAFSVAVIVFLAVAAIAYFTRYFEFGP